MSQPISSNTVLHVFDDQNITWFPFANIEHIVIGILGMDDVKAAYAEQKAA